MTPVRDSMIKGTNRQLESLLSRPYFVWTPTYPSLILTSFNTYPTFIPESVSPSFHTDPTPVRRPKYTLSVLIFTVEIMKFQNNRFNEVRRLYGKGIFSTIIDGVF